jgi:GNAT superfamily N-acetyltransferase
MVDIAAASHDDIPVVQDLAHRIWHRHYPGIITVEQIDYMLARGYATAELSRFLGTAGAGLALARVEGTPVGFAAWYRTSEPATSKLDKLYVLPEQHGRGIGRRLIAHVEACARADGSRTLLLNVNKHNASSIGAYERCGFAVRDEVVVDIGNGFVMDDYVMAKALGPVPPHLR